MMMMMMMMMMMIQKRGGARGAADNMAHVRCMLNKQGCTRAHTHRQKYVIIIAFPHQQWFREYVLMLRYTYIDSCFVLFKYAISTLTSAS
jgi:hypothetical protein